jgi:hypothetical protein
VRRESGGEGGERAVGMRVGRKFPETAHREGIERKMQMRLQRLLEPLQCVFLPHFGRRGGDRGIAGDGLRQQQPVSTRLELMCVVAQMELSSLLLSTIEVNALLLTSHFL